MTLNLKNSCLNRTKHALSKIWSFLIFNNLVRNVRLKTMLRLVDTRRLIALGLMEFVTIVTLSLKQWVCNSIILLLSMSRSSSIIDGQRNFEKDKKEGTKPNAQKNFQQKGYKIIEKWECNGWELYWTDATVKKIIFEQISPIGDLSAKNSSCKRLWVQGC